MIKIPDLTIIIPIFIDSDDRLENSKITLNYLNKHLQTNIHIFEVGKTLKIPNILKNLKNLNVKYDFIKTEEKIFHRTKYLNIMLSQCKTKVVSNYDIDILLEPEIYEKCTNLCLGDKDLVYPYFFEGEKSQRMVNKDGRNKLKKHLDLSVLLESDSLPEISRYGHCQFFKKSSYIEGGMENEDFVSYGPEDQERGFRFKNLSYELFWNDSLVYHIEHERGVNSSRSNPNMDKNNDLCSKIFNMNKEELKKYYSEVEYLKNYKK